MQKTYRKHPDASWMPRQPEPERMDDPREVAAYSEADFSEVNRAMARRAILQAGRSGRAIDIGSGPASISLELCGLAPAWKVLAVDASRGMLAEARRRIRAADLGRSIRCRRAVIAGELIRGELAAGELGRGFDLVLSNSLLHHLGDPIGFWRLARRLARPGGSIVVQDLHRPPSAAAALRLVRKHAAGDSRLLRDLFHRSLLAAYTIDEIKEQLRLAGAVDLRVSRITDRHLLVAGRKAR